LICEPSIISAQIDLSFPLPKTKTLSSKEEN